MASTQHPAVSQRIVLTCIDPWGRTRDIATTFGYRPDDPYAVSLAFHSEAGDVEWVLSRTLLLEGLVTAAGEGDVKIRPSIDDDGRAVADFDFSSPDGDLVGQASSEELQRFLSKTFTAVPVGTESSHLDLDRLVAALLDSAAE